MKVLTLSNGLFGISVLSVLLALSLALLRCNFFASLGHFFLCNSRESACLAMQGIFFLQVCLTFPIEDENYMIRNKWVSCFMLKVIFRNAGFVFVNILGCVGPYSDVSKV